MLGWGALLSALPAAEVEVTTNATDAAKTVYVIPIQGIIGRGLLHIVKRGINDAVQGKADAIIFNMNTPGGRVDVTEEIIRMMIDLPKNIETFTFVNKDALSAGSMLATSTRHIYMSPGSRIGASAIISSTGDIKEGDLKEKHVSALTALIRSAALRNHHDPKLIESMIRKSMEYKLNNEIICKKGQLLTLNDTEAARIVKRNGKEEPLLSDGTVNSLKNMLQQAHLANATVVTITMSDAEHIARFIEMFGFLFLAGGLLGIYIEFKTPGFGIPGLAGITLLAIFFWGHNIVGLSGSFELIVFLLGLILLALEIFVIPGFGVAGVSGMLLIVLSLFMSMVQHTPGGNWFELPRMQTEGALQNLGLALGISAILGMLAAKFLPKTKGFQSLMLSTALSSNKGVTASAIHHELLNAKGRAVTKLHPAGFANINGKRINVVTRGAFIEPGTPIIVTETHGNRIIVDRGDQ